MDKWIEDVLVETNKEFGEEEKREGKRFDLLCMVHDQRIVILELMRPGLKADYNHLNRLLRYVTKIQAAIEEASTKEKYKNKSVHGLLIADDFMKDASLRKILDSTRNLVDAITWEALFRDVQGRYREFLDVLKMKAPEDPRIKGLVDLDRQDD